MWTLSTLHNRNSDSLEKRFVKMEIFLCFSRKIEKIYFIHSTIIALVMESNSKAFPTFAMMPGGKVLIILLPLTYREQLTLVNIEKI